MDLKYAERTIDPSNTKEKRPKGGWRSIKYILGNETFEKLASMSLIGNISVYLKTKYNMDGISVVNVVSIWLGCSNLTAIAGALVADAWLGRFLTLLFGSISSFLGMGIMTLTAAVPGLRPPPCIDQINCTEPQRWHLAVLYLGLTLLAIGSGGIRPCNIAFGADQFDTQTEKGRAQLEAFFNWWYFSFTVALVIALTVVVYVQTNISWFIGFAIPAACLFISIIIFLIGHHTYVITKPLGSSFVELTKVVIAACRKHNLSVKGHSFYDPPLKPGSEVVKLQRSEMFKFLDKAAIIADKTELDKMGIPYNEWRLCSIQQVESLKLLVSMLPVWVSGIGCFVAMDQQSTLGILEAIQTSKTLGSHGFKIPPGWMGLSSMIALSIWIFIYEQIWVPQARKFTGKNKRLPMSYRINIGILVSIACCVLSGLVEEKRRDEALKQGTFESPMSILAFLPQFALSGLIEAFAAVALMEFLSTRLPDAMRTIGGAIFFLTLSVASYLNSLLVNVSHNLSSRGGKSPWLGGQDLNKDRLERFYYLIAGLGVLNLIYFNLVAKKYLVTNAALHKRVSECETSKGENIGEGLETSV